MNFQPFTWGANGQKASPSSVRRQAEIAAALASKTAAPKNVGEGLNRIGEVLLSNSYEAQARDGEAEGAASRKAIMDALMGNPDPTMADIGGALGNEWVTSDPGSSAIVQALLGQEMQQNDPLRQLEIQQAQQGIDLGAIELEQARNPAPVLPEAPKTATIYDPETGRDQVVQWDAAAGDWAPIGGVQAPKDPLVEVNNDLGSGKFEEVFATEDAKALGEISTAGIAAQRNLGRIDQLENLLAQSPTGFGASMAQMAGEFGINTDGLSEIQAAQALINSLVPEQRQPGSGPMSDADLNLFKQSLPRIINQPGGNALIINTMRAIAQYDAEGAAIVQKLRAGDIGRAEAFEALQARQNPLETFKAVAGDAPQADEPSGQSQANPEIFNAPAPDGVVDFSDYFR